MKTNEGMWLVMLERLFMHGAFLSFARARALLNRNAMNAEEVV